MPVTRRGSRLAVAAGASLALWAFVLPRDVLALAGQVCVSADTAPDFVPVLHGGTSPSYHAELYAIGSNNAYSAGRKCVAAPDPAPSTTVQKKSALLLVPPVTRLPPPKPPIAAAVTVPEPPQAAIEPPKKAKAPPAPKLPVATAPAPAPPPQPVQIEAEAPEPLPTDEAGYSEPSLIAPVVVGLGVAAVLTYTILDAMDEKDESKPATLAAGAEPVQALAAYDTKMLASFAAVNTVADLQSDQRISMGISSSVYDETAAVAAGMSLRLGAQGVFKTAVSFSGDEYLANAGVSYGW